MRSKVLSALPYPIQVAVGLLAYRNVSATLYGQGTGRFSTAEISSFRHHIWVNIDALLDDARRKQTETGAGDAMFWVLGGNGPSEADTTLFGFIATALVCTAYVSRDDEVIHDYAHGFLLGRPRPRRWWKASRQWWTTREGFITVTFQTIPSGSHRDLSWIGGRHNKRWHLGGTADLCIGACGLVCRICQKLGTLGFMYGPP
jgi:hypothetical protein